MAEPIREFSVPEADFTEESGHLAPFLKLKRAAVACSFEDRIQEPYER